jgi:hypothetical protein
MRELPVVSCQLPETSNGQRTTGNLQLTMATRQEANAPLLAVIGIVAILLLIVIIIGVQAWFMAEQKADIERKFSDAQPTWLVDLKTEQTQRLETARWVDQSKGIVQIPIEEAMQLIVKDQGKLPQ